MGPSGVERRVKVMTPAEGWGYSAEGWSGFSGRPEGAEPPVAGGLAGRPEGAEPPVAAGPKRWLMRRMRR